eukprot:8611128-Lingulodinium_polyedra.AAC.1
MRGGGLKPQPRLHFGRARRALASPFHNRVQHLAQSTHGRGETHAGNNDKMATGDRGACEFGH